MSTPAEQIIERLKELRDQIRYYGLILGGALVFIELMQFWQRNTMSIASTSFLFVIKLVTVFGATHLIIKRMKPTYFKKGLTYLQSFSLTMRLFLYASLLVGMFTFILNRWIEPEYLTIILENSVNTLRDYIAQAQLPTGQADYIESFIEEIEESPVPTPLTAMWGQMWSYIWWGVFVGLIISFFTKEKAIPQTNTSEDIQL